MTRVGLTMVVRDDKTTIADTIRSALPIIDRWTVVDTGSTDGTVDIVRSLLSHIPGSLHERSWHGFARNRTEALRLAADDGADYLLMLDGDHTLHIHGDQPDLTADSYLLRIEGQLQWRLPLLTRANHPFEYRGAAHAYLASDHPTVTEPLDWLTVDGGGGATRDKLERDRTLLEAAHLADPGDARTVFYLAETYRFLGHTAAAIRFYRLRADMGGWAEETYWARYQLGCLLGEHVSIHQAIPELARAYQERPHRVEALRALANLANSVADKQPVPDDVLFVIPSAYRPRQEVAA